MGLRSLENVPQLIYRTDIESACFHGNAITSIIGLKNLTSLTELNVSSNKIAALSGLETLTNLASLNLGYNLLQSCQGLQALTALTRLSLSHNRITSLKGLLPSCDLHHKMEWVDLRNNLLSNLQELLVLTHCPHLADLWLEGNPFTSMPSFRNSVMRLLPNLQRLDGRPCATQSDCDSQPAHIASSTMLLPPMQEPPIRYPRNAACQAAAVFNIREMLHEDKTGFPTKCQNRSQDLRGACSGAPVSGRPSEGTQTDVVDTPLSDPAGNAQKENQRTRDASPESNGKLEMQNTSSQTDNKAADVAELEERLLGSLRDLAKAQREVEAERKEAQKALKRQIDLEKAAEEGEMKLRKYRQQANEALRQAWEELQHSEHLVFLAQQQADAALHREAEAKNRIRELEEESQGLQAVHEAERIDLQNAMHKAVSEAKQAAVQDGMQSASSASKSMREQVQAANAAAELAQACPVNHISGTFLSFLIGRLRRPGAHQAALAERLAELNATLEAVREESAQHLEQEKKLAVEQAMFAAAKEAALEERLATTLGSLEEARKGEQLALQRCEAAELSFRMAAEQLEAKDKELDDVKELKEQEIRAAGEQIESREKSLQGSSLCPECTAAGLPVGSQRHPQATASKQPRPSFALPSRKVRRRQKHTEWSGEVADKVSESARSHKAKVVALQGENAALAAQAAAHKPEHVERLHSEVASLRERIGELSAFKVSKATHLRGGFEHKACAYVALMGWWVTRQV
eukprot:jgi/Botrbrau1/9694/Bobra.0201s0024.1